MMLVDSTEMKKAFFAYFVLSDSNFQVVLKQVASVLASQKCLFFFF